MTALKALTIVTALLVGGVSLAMAQGGPPTGGYPPVAGGAAASPIPGPNLRAATPSHPTTRHQRRLYMETNRTHKGSKLTPGY